MPIHLESPVELTEDHPEISLPVHLDRPVYGIRMISHLSYAAGLDQGYPVGQITVVSRIGKRAYLPIRAGIETAEWAYDRPDVLPTIRHDRPETRFNKQEELESGFTFFRHSYLAKWFLKKPRIPARIELKRLPGSKMSKVTLTVESLSVRIRMPTEIWGQPVSIPLPKPIVLNSESASFSIPLHLDRAVSRMVLQTNLSNAATLTDGVVVAEILLTDNDNRTERVVLRSGLDTGEWAYDRKDVIDHIQHTRPQIARSKREKDADGRDFLSHVYRAEKVWGYRSFIPRELKIRYRIPEPWSKKSTLSIYSITFL
jgi:hypothetical protein